MNVKDILELIKIQTGIDLQPCNDFPYIYKYKGKKYFNVILKDRISESKEYLILERFAKKYNLIEVEPNGLNRVAVFLISNKTLFYF